jgi:type 1 glutamine amidotransferase
VRYDGREGPGKGKHIVLISGDEEYRSEEAMPMLGKILSRHHGFRCTVLFAVNKQTGEIDPITNDNIPNLHTLRSADLMVIFTRFRKLPPEQMKHIDDYIRTGKPIIGLRTATHAFQYGDADDPYARWDFKSKMPGFEDGFGRQILGETWISHHGHHGRESTRGVIAPDMARHPIVRGCEDIWGPTDVYRVRLPLPSDCKTLVLGQVLQGMQPDDPPVAGEKNQPMMPVAWIKTHPSESGKTHRVFTTTMGASQDFASEGLRRLLVNACYWALGMEDRIGPRANVEIVGTYAPTPFRHGGHKRGLRPSDHRLDAR